ncbi:DoxX family protein [Chryseobacterium pennipullorum]|uniref:DoxX family protein n=1 Tax=Chryseobacterium pennipullorum TaxID=2258963 RepID=A0A3D9AV96_9FLAO|nr:DoxX family protein [Chryseobacterium pennipullorum]REC45269.1 DoxX family protein [Chryseobacterium pennipullorum]
MKTNFFLRFALAVVLLMHSVVSIFSGDVNNFGRVYLDSIGFSPMGLYLAWAVKLAHLLSVPLLLLNRHIQPVAVVNILIFLGGIYFVHSQNGWFVVGGGTNGVEFNFLLIFCFINLVFPDIHWRKQSKSL